MNSTLRPAVSDSILSPAMRDYWSGMQCLHRYAARCHADIEAIGGDNLRVLHNTLLTDPHYRKILAEAERGTSRRGLPISRKLFSSVEIDAELVTLRQGCSLRLAPRPEEWRLLMMLSGQATVSGTALPPTLTRTVHRWLTGSRAISVRSGDVVWEKPDDSEPVLSAASNSCVLLRVRLSIASFSGSPHNPLPPAMAAVG